MLANCPLDNLKHARWWIRDRGAWIIHRSCHYHRQTFSVFNVSFHGQELAGWIMQQRQIFLTTRVPIWGVTMYDTILIAFHIGIWNPRAFNTATQRLLTSMTESVWPGQSLGYSSSQLSGFILDFDILFGTAYPVIVCARGCCFFNFFFHNIVKRVFLYLNCWQWHKFVLLVAACNFFLTIVHY